MQLRISRAIEAELRDRAAASPDREVCGLVFGTRESVESISVCANVAPDPERTFEIDPAALIAAHRAERGGGPMLIGCWHSHPNGVAAPSARDLASAARDGHFWLIVTPVALTGWCALADGFARVTLRY